MTETGAILQIDTDTPTEAPSPADTETPADADAETAACPRRLDAHLAKIACDIAFPHHSLRVAFLLTGHPDVRGGRRRHTARLEDVPGHATRRITASSLPCSR